MNERLALCPPCARRGLTPPLVSRRSRGRPLSVLTLRELLMTYDLNSTGLLSPEPHQALNGEASVITAVRTAEQERMRSEQQLRASEARYRDLFENAPNAYLVVDTDGR